MKKKVNYNVSEKVINDFKEVTKLKAINKSQLIENLIIKWIKENK
jgi:hypothetical protein